MNATANPANLTGPSSSLERLLRSIEAATPIDRISEAIRPTVQRVVGEGGLRDLLTGRLLGHPLHPAGVAIPMSCWIGGTLVDVLGGATMNAAARRLIGLGTLAAVPVAVTGAADWLDTRGAEQRVGTVHAAANDAALSMFALSWLQRRRGRRTSGVALALAGTTVMGAAAYLGGHLAFRRGVGVDTTAFQSGPDDWQQVTIDATVEPSRVAEGRLGGLSFAVIGRDGDQPPDVMESRCTHRGGPLHEGEVDGDCIVCPWHGSRFDRRTGAVVAGPASAPQPVYEVRVGDDAIDGAAIVIRRAETGGLRRNPVGARHG